MQTTEAVRATPDSSCDIFVLGVLRMHKAVLSLLAGDLFRGTPIHWSPRAFKGFYHAMNLLHPRRTLLAWRYRKRTLRERLPETAAS